ncbi:MAG TPA: circadian clock KaiB family protein [Thermoleophilaceae bacterium]|nr:circadian clock KaiB family protein [Thermoleophilaceae bacterium]
MGNAAPPGSALERLEAALRTLKEARYELTLFVSGASSSSARAITNARELFETHLPGRYDLTIVDVNQDPELARGSRVLATPTLLKGRPGPERMVVGDLSDGDRVLLALDVLVVDSPSEAPGV